MTACETGNKEVSSDLNEKVSSVHFQNITKDSAVVMVRKEKKTWKQRRMEKKALKQQEKQLKEAPAHNAPNQAEIDSIKNAKAKTKNL
jgi:hypothetical protein